jgi:outer membrane protein OmpA-like peptidoglycan-associated protein
MSTRARIGICPTVICLTMAFFLEFGCSTKKYVKQSIDPVSGRVDELTELSKKNEAAIKDVDGRAQSGIQSVQTKTDEVDQKAVTAGQKADQAAEMAKNNDSHLSKVETSLNEKIASIDSFKPDGEASIQFKFDRADLTDESKAKLDELAARVKDSKNYVLEIRGFTDRTGDEKYNLGLSHRRSESVIRYLVQQHQIPLFRMFVLGLGESGEVQDNNTREGRAANRRVDIVLLRSGSDNSPVKSSSAGQANPISAGPNAEVGSDQKAPVAAGTTKSTGDKAQQQP